MLNLCLLKKRIVILTLLLIISTALMSCSGTNTPNSNTAGSPTLNDTGIILCGNLEQNIAKCEASFPNQDAQTGRDNLAKRNMLIKIGSGEAGFDFSKLSSNGLALSIQNTAWQTEGSEQEGSLWHCVRDNTTGLTWEVKQALDTDPRSSLSTYSWYNANIQENGGIQGTENKGECNQNSCDTQSYIRYLNDTQLCGFDDWRLPTPTELHSIGHLGKNDPAIDNKVFPNNTGLRHWSATTDAAFAQLAWYVYFSDASISFTDKSNASFVRLVRSPKVSAISLCDAQAQDRYAINADNTVTDTHTQLTWLRCPVGFEWSQTNNMCDEQSNQKLFSWQQALQFASDQNSLSNKQWRLPNPKELESIVNRNCANPAITTRYFSPMALSNFWTSSTSNGYAGNAWAINFLNGSHVTLDKKNTYAIRLVSTEP